MGVNVTVAYGGRRAQVPVTPNSLLSDVRDAACDIFYLSKYSYTLVHQRRPVDLSLTFRLTELVANATLELERAQFAESEPIRVKLRGTPYTGTHCLGSTVADVLAAAGVTGTAVYIRPLEPGTVLGLLGVKKSVVLDFEKKPFNSTNGHQKGAILAKQEESAAMPAEIVKERAQKQEPVGPANRQAEVILKPRLSAESVENPPEMTERQFHTYLSHLRDEAGPRAMISRSTREKLLKEHNASAQVVLRVRLPDGCLLQGTFNATETGASVYSFVQSHLRYPAPFELRFTTPAMTLEPEMKLTDCGYGARALLLMCFKGPVQPQEPVLSDKALSLAQRTQDHVEQASTNGAALEPAAAEAPEAVKKKMPKWLKLHK